MAKKNLRIALLEQANKAANKVIEEEIELKTKALLRIEELEEVIKTGKCKHIAEDVISTDCSLCHLAWCELRIKVLEKKLNQQSHSAQFRRVELQQKRIEELEKESKNVREYLWLSHGHQGIYGDDGEMQCAQCSPWDYKRSNLLEVVKGAITAKFQSLKSSIIEKLEKAKFPKFTFKTSEQLNKKIEALIKELGGG